MNIVMNWEQLEDELKDRRFNQTVDYYLAHGKLAPGMIEDLTRVQSLVLNCLKRSLKRAAYPDELSTDDE